MPGTVSDQAASEARDHARGDKPKSFDKNRSKLVSKSADREVYKNPDGTETVHISQAPVHVKDAAGAWKDVDLALTKQDDGRLHQRQPLVDSVIAGSTDQDLLTIPVDGGALVLHSDHLTPGKAAEVVENAARFDDALPAGIGLDVTALRSGAETAYRVPNRDALVIPLTERLSVPNGWTARQSGDDVEFLNADGAVAAVWAHGIARDGAGVPEATGVKVVLDSVSGGDVLAHFEIDPEWAGDPGREFPITVDPFVTIVRKTNENYTGDSWVRSGVPSQNAWSDPFLYAGRHPSAQDIWRSVLTFNPGLPGDAVVSNAYIQLLEANAGRCPAGSVYAQRNTAAWGPPVTWADAPGFTDSINQGYDIGNSRPCADDLVTFPVTTYTQAWVGSANNLPTGLSVPNYGVTLFSADEAITTGDRYHAYHSAESPWVPELWITYDRTPGIPTQTAPADAQTVLTTRPQLSVNAATDPDGETVKYLFQIATGADAQSGQTVTSGYVTTPTFQPPDGALVDGTTYYWKAYTADFDALDNPIATSRPSLVRSFKVDQRLGTSSPSPYDTYGPVAVNLATGNATINVAGTRAAALGGDLGLSLAYDARTPKNAGLVGRYYLDDNQQQDFSGQLVMTRRDPTIDFDWGTGAPSPAVDLDNPTPADYFLVRWDGYVTPSTQGNWKFGAIHDDGVKVSINSSQVTPASAWNGGPVKPTPDFGSSVNAGPNDSLPIRIDYSEQVGASRIQLWAQRDSDQPIVVPADWLKVDDSPLPRGWTATSDLDGTLAFTSATDAGTSVILRSPDGDTSEFKVVAPPAGTLNPTNAATFTAPADEDGVLTRDDDRTLTLIESDGQTYHFDSKGRLDSVTSAANDLKPSTLTYAYGVTDPGGPPRLLSITDPVSNRVLSMGYSGYTNDGGSSGSCATLSPPDGRGGVNHGPKGGLSCVFLSGANFNPRLVMDMYYDSSSKELKTVYGNWDLLGSSGAGTYDVYDFEYLQGRLTGIRSPLAYDAIQNAEAANDATSLTTIAYVQGATRDQDVVSAVTLPAPSAGAARPNHTYVYGANRLVKEADGAASPVIRTVGLDASARAISDADQAGVVTTNTWNADDQVTSTTDGAGLKTTTIYDYAKRPVTVYGPAPVACFNGLVPKSPACSPAVPAASTTYDGGIKGLAASYFVDQDNTHHFAGGAVLHGTGVNSSGSLVKDWGGGAPTTNGSPVLQLTSGGVARATKWSARFTGEVQLDQVGAYDFYAYSDDGVRIFVDDKLLAENWGNHYYAPTTRVALFTNTVAGSRHRIRVDYFQGTGSSRLELSWSRPDNLAENIPGDHLFPR
ncbi:MAG: DNRLRE domain-containing protein, partial [Actinobacteria bacterium]|nr:DNRLRE domain-containing protein [Actinomycetota bacterium]